jgi:hypothetical protein
MGGTRSKHKREEESVHSFVGKLEGNTYSHSEYNHSFVTVIFLRKESGFAAYMHPFYF